MQTDISIACITKVFQKLPSIQIRDSESLAIKMETYSIALNIDAVCVVSTLKRIFCCIYAAVDS